MPEIMDTAGQLRAARAGRPYVAPLSADERRALIEAPITRGILATDTYNRKPVSGGFGERATRIPLPARNGGFSGWQRSKAARLG